MSIDQQLTLFDAMLPDLANTSRGSRRAAAAIRPHRPSQRQRVVDFVCSKESFGATREEIASFLNMRLSSVCARVSEAIKLGELRHTKGDRIGTSGIAVEVLYRLKP